MDAINVTSWIAGWTALVFVILYGVFLSIRARRLVTARGALSTRILVTGSRGKSGTVRLIHEILRRNGLPTFGKVTGTTAVELYPDGTEVPTTRLGAACVNEMPSAVMRANQLGATTGVFECMAVSPSLIELVSESHIKPHIVVVPTIRLDHLEEEGLDEVSIARSIVDSVGKPGTLVVGVQQPEILELFRATCRERGITLVEAVPRRGQPVVPGHHPTNVAVALAVSSVLGISDASARAAMNDSTREPRVMAVQSFLTSHKKHLEVIDLGGANDPQSAYEAIEALGYLRYPVIPIVVNRWERPLRSLVFLSAVLAKFPIVGVAGTLSWLTHKFHGLIHSPRGANHSPSRTFRLTRAHASNLEYFANSLFALVGKKRVTGVTVLILENTHDPTIDLLRSTLDDRAQTHELVPVGV